MRIDDIFLIQAAFNIYQPPTKDLQILREYRTEKTQENEQTLLVVQSVLFTITQEEDVVAEILLKYLIAVFDGNDIPEDERDLLLFNHMRHTYMAKANDFLMSAHFPVAYEKDIHQIQKS